MNHYDFWSEPGEGFFGDPLHAKHERRLRVQLAGSHVCYGGKGGGGSPDPDPQIGQAAIMQAQTGQDWLNFSKEQFAISNKRQEKVDELNDQIQNEQLTAMRDSGAQSRAQWERYNEKYKPVEDRLIDDANNWDSAERQEVVAAEAKGDVMSSAAAAQQQNQRQMASMGVDPRSGRYAGIEKSADLSTALAAAGAQNSARSQVRMQGAAMREGVANMGRGATSTAAQQLGLGLQAGNSAMGNQLGVEGNFRANQQIMNQGFQGAMQGYSGQANTLMGQQGQAIQAQGQENQAAAAKGQATGAIVGTIGTIALAF